MFKKTLAIFLIFQFLLNTADFSHIPFSMISVAWADEDNGANGDHGSDSDSDHENDSDSDGTTDAENDPESENNSTNSEDDSDNGENDIIEYRKLERLRKAVNSNQVLSLGKVKTIIRRNYGKQIIKVKIKQNWFRWIYEFKVISAKGRVLEVYVDAKTGKTIKVRND